jgi:hypothetical protein
MKSAKHIRESQNKIVSLLKVTSPGMKVTSRQRIALKQVLT